MQFWLEWSLSAGGDEESLGIWNYPRIRAANATRCRVEVLEVAKGRQRDDVVSRAGSS